MARRFGPATRPVVTLVVTGLASAAAPLALLHTCFEGTVGADVDLVVSSDLERTLADRIDAEFGIRRTVSFPGTSLAGLVALTGSDIVVGLEATAVPVGPWLSHVVRTFEQHQADVVCSRFVAFDGTLRSAGGESRGDATTAIGMGEDPEAEPFRRVRVVDAAAGPVTAVHGRRLDPTTHPKVVYQPEWVVVALDGAPQFPARPH